MKVSLPKDTRGIVRRDIQEEKETQMQQHLISKLRPCLNFNVSDPVAKDDDMQIDQGNKKEFVPIEILINLNVIQDKNQDGNLNCALLAACNDLLF